MSTGLCASVGEGMALEVFLRCVVVEAPLCRRDRSGSGGPPVWATRGGRFSRRWRAGLQPGTLRCSQTDVGVGELARRC